MRKLGEDGGCKVGRTILHGLSTQVLAQHAFHHFAKLLLQVHQAPAGSPHAECDAHVCMSMKAIIGMCG